MRRLRAFAALIGMLALLPVSVGVGQGVVEGFSGTATRVIDGDTVEVLEASGATTTVRLIGIDTPESVKPGTRVECGGQEAAQYLRSLVEGKAVTLITDPTQDRTDRFGRLPAYVDQAGSDVGLEMIRAGWAAVYVYDDTPFERLAEYRAAENLAERHRAGVWGSCGGDFHSEDEDDDVARERAESAERFVRTYYARLSRKRYSSAWNMLSVSLRRQLGPYRKWRAGFRRSLGTRVTRSDGTWSGSRATVRVVLRSRDRDACSGRVVQQSFRGRWVLVRARGSWRMTRATIWKVSGRRVRVSKNECPRSSPPPRPPSDGGDGDGSGGGGCHPSYTPCVPTNRGDLDCPDIGHSVTVVGPDEYRLDADNDGTGCDSYG